MSRGCPQARRCDRGLDIHSCEKALVTMPSSGEGWSRDALPDRRPDPSPADLVRRRQRAARARATLAMAAGRADRGGARLRSPAAAVAARASRRRPVRFPGRGGPLGRGRRGLLRRRVGRSRGHQRRPPRWPADHVRARDPLGRGRAGSRARTASRPAPAGTSALRRTGLPALGPAPGRGVPGPAAAGATAGAAAQAAREPDRGRASVATTAASRS